MIHRTQITRTLGTALILALIMAGIAALWWRYQVEPVTRDGKVRADLVPVAPDVGGLVTSVAVHDNMPVKAGQILFTIDPPRYRLALAQAEAATASQSALLAQAIREDRRNRAMPDVVPAEQIEQGSARVATLQATLAAARAAEGIARLNLARTVVRAPVDGAVTNVSMQPGIYLAAGKPALALVHGASLRVEGYFEETKLPAIRNGDPASVYLMGVSDEVRGHVESIASGVEDRERSGSDAQLANINPSFTWVRLAQRIPVRIAIDQVPAGVRLIPGQTATIVIHPRGDGRSVHRSLPW